MRLTYAPTSPYVRKVVVLLHETGQVDDVELIPVVTTPMAPADAVRTANPLARIPALERSDGPTLYDSRVVCAFLDDRAGGRLYPDGAARWDALVLEATGDGMMDSGVSMSYENNFRPADKQWPDWLEAQSGKIRSACKALNDRWMSHLQGPLDIGHVSVACALSYIDFRHPGIGWRDGNDGLAAWHKAFESRPGMVATQLPEA
jgi:glutathione S-transferase